ncbi:hypothetical protein KXD40_004673 [Peronospora effusa]|uniref:Uncharacterized protein n=1 Tax=Peronospora effusa TaxID=542832 RepID=A0A3M6VVY1_9STRA|nr:hypothetical protein DD238_006241 [Peronospora effusa]RQM12814.1 hypothetical protein DD237_008150 [Peronospora effusa]UIZ27814.1 hypothetical protein KXD40_004673 [Peronospora effusa]CAI5721492.1 unnamed protein product [Peronospora effusa]
MKIGTFLFVALVIATIIDQATAMETATYDMEKLNEQDDEKVSDPNSKNELSPPAPTPAPTLECNHTKQVIGHNKIKPLPQPIPVTISEMIAVKFKPMLRVSNGCHPYPAVNAEGETSAGLKTTGSSDGNCKGSQWGSQVYGRSTLFRKHWVIVYAWYFPKDSPAPYFGHRHDWEHVILWLEFNLDNNCFEIGAVTPSAHDGFSKHRPPDASTVNNTNVKIEYLSKWPMNHALQSTSEEGSFQDLILWHQLPENARCALNSVYWGNANMPLRDLNFYNNLKKAYPY